MDASLDVKMSTHGLPMDWKCLTGVLVIPGYISWKQTFSHITFYCPQHGITLNIIHVGRLEDGENSYIPAWGMLLMMVQLVRWYLFSCTGSPNVR